METKGLMTWPACQTGCALRPTQFRGRSSGFEFDMWNKGALKSRLYMGYIVSESFQQLHSRRFHKHKVGTFTSGNILSFNQNRNTAVRAPHKEPHQFKPGRVLKSTVSRHQASGFKTSAFGRSGFRKQYAEASNDKNRSRNIMPVVTGVISMTSTGSC